MMPSSTDSDTLATQPSSNATPRTSSSTAPSDERRTPPKASTSQTADDQPRHRDDDQQSRLPRATKKKLQHSRWRARGTLRNCIAEERALLENLRSVQHRILHLQDAALRDSAVMAQADFCSSPWQSGWRVEFGETAGQLGWGFGPSDVAPRKGSVTGVMRRSIDAAAKQRSNSKAGVWTANTTAPILNAHLIPLTQAHPQLQIITPNNQPQIPNHLQAPFLQPYAFSPGLPSPFLLDPETTAEDLYAWQNGDADATADPYDCVDPSSVLYNVDPYYSFSYSPSASFSYPTATPQSQQQTAQHDDSQPTTQYATDPAEANPAPPCTSPFPERWDLATALRVGRTQTGGGAPNSIIVAEDGAAGRRHVRALSALLSPRGSCVLHIDDLVPPPQADPGPRSAGFESRKPSLAEPWAPPRPTSKGKGKAKALNPTSPTFVPGATWTMAPPPPPPSSSKKPAVAVMMAEMVDASPKTTVKRPETAEEAMAAAAAASSGCSSFSSAADSAASAGARDDDDDDSSAPSSLEASPASSAGGEKRRYSAAAVDLLLNRFRENAANPIKKRRSWKKARAGCVGSVGGAGSAEAMFEGMRVMGVVGEEGAEEIQIMMEVV
ncbi:hypothetical protein SLS56_006186 [Neofusicoccum ribis]|uniref:BZIP domain-containing protein n=1 Tax=Neofusicoccum ribis TaxID=45134 RepID=A0ABR3SRL1_9PEZI